MSFFRKINAYQIVLLLLLTSIQTIAVADEFTCGIYNADNSPKLAVVSVNRANFYDIVFGKLLPDGKTTHLEKGSFEGQSAYLVRGNEVVIKESPAGYAEYDGKCFVSYINREGILTSGFIDKNSLKLLPVATNTATIDTWSDAVFFVGKDGFTRLEIKKDSVQYQVIRARKSDAGGILQFDFDIISHSFTKLHISESGSDQCNLVLWRLHHYLYVEAKDCGGRGDTFERLLRKKG